MATCNSSSHAIGAVACPRDSIGSGSLMIRLPNLRTVPDVCDLEIAASFLAANLLCFRCCPNVGLDDIAVRLILQVDV